MAGYSRSDRWLDSASTAVVSALQIQSAAPLVSSNKKKEKKKRKRKEKQTIFSRSIHSRIGPKMQHWNIFPRL